MRLSIDHRTVYRFSTPQSRLVQMLRMTPENSHDQTVARWRIDVDCDATMRRGRDGFGNAVTMLYCEGPIAHIEVAVRGEVLTSHSDGVVHGVAEALPPALYLRATEMTPRDPAITAFAEEVTATADGVVGMLHRLNRAFHDRFRLDRARPAPGLSAAAAFARDAVTSRDFAQMFCVASRSLGIPARYVTGYSIVEGAVRPTPHGWAEAFVEGLGWVGFDPCTGRSPQEESVRVAAALDASGAAPVAGSRLGEGEEELDVAVTVSAED
jgi:transglutaminase-like putative cysteine protease